MTELIRKRWPGSTESPITSPPTIDIRQNASEPIDPAEPSFLTTLPAKLRNEVYKWLFHRDEPIIYTGKSIEPELTAIPLAKKTRRRKSWRKRR
jgi:hypothetical protein